MEITILITILLAAFALFVSRAVSIEVVSILIVATLALSGILAPKEALSGFSSTATLTVAAMLVLSAGLVRSGVVDYISATLEKWAGGSRSQLLIGLGSTSGLFSAFINNTAVVAILIPVVLALSRRCKIVPSKLLIPVSYFAIVGGTCTLIGTSTNILVDSLYRTSGGPGFGMFEFASLGIIFLVLGSIYLFLFSDKLLPERTSLSQMLSHAQLSKFVTEVTVPSNSNHIGKSIEELFIRADEIRVMELIRTEEAILNPDLKVAVAAGDTFLVEASARAINNLLTTKGVDYATAVSDHQRVKISRFDLMTMEAVVTPNSRFLGQKIRDVGLSRQYGVYVLAARRLGSGHHIYNLRDFVLRSGDVLLIQGDLASLHALQESGDILLIEGVEKTLTLPGKAPVAVAILTSVVVLAALGVAPIVFLAFAGVGIMLLSGCLKLAQANRALDSSVLFLLAAMIPMGQAMEKTGLASLIANWVVDVAGSHGPVVLISCFYLVTNVLTEFMSNNATAVLMTPVALAVASGLGVDPKALLIAITFGASASFSTPIGYQTNTLVMGPGGYFFRDFLKIGLPLNILLWIVASILIPVFWPL